MLTKNLRYGKYWVVCYVETATKIPADAIQDSLAEAEEAAREHQEKHPTQTLVIFEAVELVVPSISSAIAIL